MLLAQSRTRIGAVFVDEMTSVNRFVVRARFRNLFPIEIDNKTVGHTDLVGRAMFERDAGHERRLKPARC